MILGSMNKMGLLFNIIFVGQSVTILFLQKRGWFHYAKWMFLIVGTFIYGIINVVYGNMIPADAGFLLYIILTAILLTTPKGKAIGIVVISSLYIAPSYLFDGLQNLFYQELPMEAYYFQLLIMTSI
ncbi:MAG: hypothetical protein AAF573_21835, partial [Bacteroidota bacterium]